MSNPSYKTTKWTNLEVEEVKKYVEEGLSYEQISIKVNRSPKTIQNLVENRLMLNLSEEAQHIRQAEIDIKSSPEWTQLCMQLSEDEQDYFLYNWRESVAQFKNDMTHTEKLQLIEMIRTEILINRTMGKLNLINTELIRLQTELDETMSESEIDKEQMMNVARSIAETIAGQGTISKEYEALSKRKDQILKDIKGTRDQRVTRIEQSKDTLTAWIAALVADSDLRRDLGITMEKNRIAKEVQYMILTDYFKYCNGELEQPILTHSSIKDDNH